MADPALALRLQPSLLPQEELSGGTQHKIVVLCPVICLPEAQPSHQPCLHNGKMADIVVGQKQIQIKVTLPMQIVKCGAAFLALILIRIEKTRYDPLLPCSFNLRRHLKESVRCQEIIVIQKPDVVSCCLF